MQKVKFLLLLSLSLLLPNLYAMEVSSSAGTTSTFQVRFMPQEKEQARNDLFSLLDNANKRVLIAMYWIMDNDIVDKLISTKKRGIDIQVIFDESSRNKNFNICPDPELISKFLDNNIVPIIFPSQTLKKNKMYQFGNSMHNKFLVFDRETVFTGSANFTGLALNPNTQSFNYENITIINSNEVAQNYRSNFFNIEKKTFNSYINIVASNNAENLPQWMHDLLPIIYQDKLRLQPILDSRLKQFNWNDQQQLKWLFGIEAPTQNQKIEYNWS